MTLKACDIIIRYFSAVSRSKFRTRLFVAEEGSNMQDSKKAPAELQLKCVSPRGLLALV